jgi:DNA-binding MarR family transcriptional regulator
MNKKSQKPNDLFNYQTHRLQNLITEMIECCQDRHVYEHQKFGVPYAELKCLLLFNGERYLTVKGIAEKLEVAKSRVTKIINGLIEKKLVKRFEDHHDKRVKLICLTPEGGEKCEQVRNFQRQIHQDILKQFDSEKRKQLFVYLESLRSAMESVKQTLT